MGGPQQPVFHQDFDYFTWNLWFNIIKKFHGLTIRAIASPEFKKLGAKIGELDATEQIKYVTPLQLAGLDDEIKELKKEQFAALGHAQFVAIEDTQVQHIHVDCFEELTPFHASILTEVQAAKVTANQFKNIRCPDNYQGVSHSYWINYFGHWRN